MDIACRDVGPGAGGAPDRPVPGRHLQEQTAAGSAYGSAPTIAVFRSFVVTTAGRELRKAAGHLITDMPVPAVGATRHREDADDEESSATLGLLLATDSDWQQTHVPAISRVLTALFDDRVDLQSVEQLRRIAGDSIEPHEVWVVLQGQADKTPDLREHLALVDPQVATDLFTAALTAHPLPAEVSARDITTMAAALTTLLPVAGRAARRTALAGDDRALQGLFWRVWTFRSLLDPERLSLDRALARHRGCVARRAATMGHDWHPAPRRHANSLAWPFGQVLEYVTAMGVNEPVADTHVRVSTTADQLGIAPLVGTTYSRSSTCDGGCAPICRGLPTPAPPARPRRGPERALTTRGMAAADDGRMAFGAPLGGWNSPCARADR